MDCHLFALLVLHARGEQTRSRGDPVTDGRFRRAARVERDRASFDATVRVLGDWKNDLREVSPVRGVYFHVRRWVVCEHESVTADKRRGGDCGEVLFASHCFSD
jgi:hypothetical protein|tara:strand:+ start:824 stop:1135 length:312 start_codon:yes stop_codon:yes gene_type:complete